MNTNFNFEFLADRQDVIPVVAKWYFEEWEHKVPGNSIEQTIDLQGLKVQ
jgi:hypothetical protein